MTTSIDDLPDIHLEPGEKLVRYGSIPNNDRFQYKRPGNSTWIRRDSSRSVGVLPHDTIVVVRKAQQLDPTDYLTTFTQDGRKVWVVRKSVAVGRTDREDWEISSAWHDAWRPLDRYDIPSEVPVLIRRKS